MQKISIYLFLSLLIIIFIVGVGFGYYLTPEYKLSMFDKSQMSLGQADKWFDLRYIDAMISHHTGAILLAKQAEKSQRQEIKDLALEIQKNEPVLIKELYQWKKDWYKDSRVVKDPVVANLGNYDDKFDLRFLNALIYHHEIGVEMTKETKIKSSNTTILNNADAVENFLLNSAKMLSEWRSNWYKI